MVSPFAFLGATLLRPLAALIPAILAGLLVVTLGDQLPSGDSRLAGIIVLATASLLFFAVYAATIWLTGAVTADDLGFLRNVFPHRTSSPNDN